MDLTPLYQAVADAWAAGVVTTMNVHVKDEAEARAHMQAARAAGMRLENEIVVHDICETVTAHGPGFISRISVLWHRPESVPTRRAFVLGEVAECQ